MTRTAMSRSISLALLVPALVACQTSAHSSTTDGSPGQARAEVLFDGTSTAAWRAYKGTDLPAGWQVVDGALTRVADAGDIVTREEYRDFVLDFQWKVTTGANSGVMFHVTEDHDAPWETGPEFQILDNQGHKDGLDPRTSAGSNYAMDAPTADVTRPPGEWNQARILVRGAHVEHWLNGQKIVAYELWTPDWEKRVSECKWKDRPDYGRRKSGHIALQDHGDRIAFRDIRIQRLDAP